jgi:hypothetical protein
LGYLPERLPGEPGKFGDVEAHLRRTIKVSAEGKEHIIRHPGNYPHMFDAYLNSEGDASVSLITDAYQRYLKTDSTGQQIAVALEKIVNDPELEPTIHKALGNLRDEERCFYYDQMVKATIRHLPEDFDTELLWSPHLEDYDPDFTAEY